LQGSHAAVAEGRLGSLTRRARFFHLARARRQGPGVGVAAVVRGPRAGERPLDKSEARLWTRSSHAHRRRVRRDPAPSLQRGDAGQRRSRGQGRRSRNHPHRRQRQPREPVARDGLMGRPASPAGIRPIVARSHDVTHLADLGMTSPGPGRCPTAGPLRRQRSDLSAIRQNSQGVLIDDVESVSRGRVPPPPAGRRSPWPAPSPSVWSLAWPPGRPAVSPGRRLPASVSSRFRAPVSLSPHKQKALVGQTTLRGP
jgi:hypothetical protein